MRVEFARLEVGAVLPSNAHAGDAGWDLHAIAPARIEPGAREAIGTGLAVAIPDGYAGLVLPRSGLALRHGISLVNAPGLIDAGYRGELRVLLLNTDRESAVEIAAGDRIAQLLIVRHEAVEAIEVDALGSSERASSGFGSSGL